MAKRIRGFRRKTRYKFKKEPRRKGKMNISEYMKNLKQGDKVTLAVESSVQKGMYSPRFMGKMGIIRSRKGRCYEIDIKDGGKTKTIIAHPVHLKRL